MRTPTTLLLAAVATAALPAAASAATITASATCAASFADVGISGTGFTPNGPVTISGDADRYVTADALGSFQTTVSAPFLSRSSMAVKQAALTATDGTDATITAQTGFSYVSDYFNTNAPLSGKPSAKTTWRFAGFVSGQSIYGHYRFNKKTIKNYRFGKAKGVCGTLTVRARRLPAKSRPGTWTLQLDQKKSYNRFTKPRRTVSFTIFRRFY